MEWDVGRDSICCCCWNGISGEEMEMLGWRVLVEERMEVELKESRPHVPFKYLMHARATLARQQEVEASDSLQFHADPSENKRTHGSNTEVTFMLRLGLVLSLRVERENHLESLWLRAK